MRTLKKTLCLVLCLAMMVGLCAIGANAIEYKDYPDKDKIEHEEAVMLLTALGVLQGDAQGYRPGDGLTRAEGAKIVVALQNIQPTGTSTFTDMAGAEWAQPYVGYLQSQKITEGVGGGKFDPQGKLLFAEFAAMLLRALGYDKDREQMTGIAYEVGVARLVNALDLAHGVAKVDYKAPISRDDAAQLAFNLLTKNVVSYTGALTLDKGNLALNAETVENIAYDFMGRPLGYAGGQESRLQFCEYFWPTLKCTNRWDAAGNPTRYWFFGKSRTDNIFRNNAIASGLIGNILAKYDKPGDVNYATVWEDAGFTGSDWLEVRENGWDSGYVIGGDSEIFLTRNDRRNFLPYAGTNAALIDLDENGIADYLQVNYAYLAMVTRIIPATESVSGDREIQLRVFDGSGSIATFPTDSFSRGDMVLAYADPCIGEPVWSIFAVETAKTAVGKLTKIGLARDGSVTSLTVGGTAYDVAMDELAIMGIGGPVSANNYDLGKTYTLYLANGCVIGVSGEAPRYDNFVFYMNDQFVRGANDLSTPYTVNPDADYWKIGYVKQDATTGIGITMAAADEIDPAVAAHAWGWYIPALNADGTTSLISPADDNNDLTEEVVVRGLATADLKKDLPGAIRDGATRVVTDNSTVYVLYTHTGFKTYTGISKLPTYDTTANPVDVYALVVDGFAYAVYIDVHNLRPIGAAITETVFILNQAPISVEYDEENDVNVYTYRAIVDGKFGTVKSTASGETPATTLPYGLINPARDANGYIVARGTTPAAGVNYYAYDGSAIRFHSDTIVINDQPILTDAKTKVFYVSSTRTIEAGEAWELEGLSGDAWVVPVSPRDATASVIYLVF